MQSEIASWGDAIMASLGTAFAMFFSSIPRILGFVVILVIGWIIASIIEKALATLLRAVNFDVFSERAGLAGFLQKAGRKNNASGVLASIAKWFVRLITLMVAFDALGLPAVSEVLRQLLMWLPNLAVALAVLVIGGIAANALSDLVRSAAIKGDLENPAFLAAVARNAVWVFAVIVAINQIGIAAALVNIFFIGIVGALALALGLSFGLGGRDTAGAIVRRWHAHQLSPRGRLSQSVDEAAPQGLQEFAGNERRQMIADRRSPYARRAA